MPETPSRKPAPKFFGISGLQLDPADAHWLAGAGAELLEMGHGGNAGEREAIRPQITLALVRTFLRRSCPTFRAAVREPTVDPEELARDSWGFKGGHRPSLIAGLVRLEAADIRAGRPPQAVISRAWMVPEPRSSRGAYVTEDGIPLRLLGAVCIQRDIDGACRACGELVASRRWRNDSGTKPHTRWVRHCATCEPAPRETRSLVAVFADLRLAIRPPERPGLTYEQITVPFPDAA